MFNYPAKFNNRNFLFQIIHTEQKTGNKVPENRKNSFDREKEVNRLYPGDKRITNASYATV